MDGNRKRRATPMKRTDGSTKDGRIWMLRIDTSDNGGNVYDDVAFHNAVFHRLEASALAPRWITADECLRKVTKNADVYVLPAFVGPVFDHLIRIKCRVYGSLLVLTCLNNSERLPKWTHPIFSMTMKGAVVCFTGFNNKTREYLMAKVLHMGGTYSKDFNDEVTHLVAAFHKPDSEKYIAATNRKIPIMSRDWIDRAWAAAESLNEACYVDPEIADSLRLKLFSGCVMTCSGVAVPERGTLARIIESNGGLFKGDMQRNKCTHLLTDRVVGEKYRKAREWGWETIKIVRVKWLHKCVEKGYRISERFYEPKAMCSTPQQSREATPVDCEISAISGMQRRGADQLERSDASLSATMGGFLDPKRTARTANNVSVVVQTPVISGRSLIRCSSSSRKLNESIMSIDPIDTLDIGDLPVDDYLEGCRIFLCGIDESKMNKWKLLINLTGASRSGTLDCGVTHAVVGNGQVDQKIFEQMKESLEKIRLVKSDWLIECAKSRRLTSESEYAYVLSKEKEWSRPSASRDEEGVSQAGASRANVVAVLRQTQHSNQKISSRRILDPEVATACSGEVRMVEQENVGVRAGDVMEEGGKHSEPPHSSIFSGLTFRVLKLDDANADEMCLAIAQCGGLCVSSSTEWVNYVVVPVLDFDEPITPARLNSDHVVTTYWVQCCVEKEAVLNPSSHPLCRPITARRGSIVFENCVVALSTVPAGEKEVYTELLETFGAIVQNRMARSDTKQLKKSTHVIAGAESERTKTARKWSLPVLDPSWIIESVLQGKRMLEESFFFCEEPFKDYCRNDEIWLLASPVSASEFVESGPHETNNYIITEMGGFLAEGVTNQTLATGDVRQNDMQQHKHSTDIGRGVEKMGQPEQEKTLDSMSDSALLRLIDEQENNEETAAPPSSHADGRAVIAGLPVATPINKRIQELRGVSSNMASPTGSPLCDTPSKFLDPTKKFIPHFDLRDAFAYVDALEQAERSMASSCDRSWTDSVVGRTLDEAVLKTARMEVSCKKPPPWPDHFSIPERCESDTAVKVRNIRSDEALQAKRKSSLENMVVATTSHSLEDRMERSRDRVTVVDKVDVLSKPTINEKKRMIVEKLARLTALRVTSMAKAAEKSLEDSTTAANSATSERKRPLEANVSTARAPSPKRVNLREDAEEDLSQPVGPVIGWEETPSTRGPRPQLLGDTFSTLVSESRTESRPVSEAVQPIVEVEENVGERNGVTNRPSVEEAHASTRVSPEMNARMVNLESKRTSSDAGTKQRNEGEIIAGPPKRNSAESEESSSELRLKKTLKSSEHLPIRSGTGCFPTTNMTGSSITCVTVPSTSSNETVWDKPRKFLFSALTDNERKRFSRVIERLGGESLSDFTDEATHLVCGQIIRNEKVLSSIACGIFLIEPKYVEDCDTAGKWLNAEDYEWGNPKRIQERRFSNIRAEELAKASYRWRVKINRTSPPLRAFSGWNALLYCSRRRSNDVSRIITYGGGKCQLRDDVSSFEGFTLALVEKSKYWNSKEIRLLVSQRLKCFTIDYIATHLTEENINEENHLHPDYLKNFS